MCRPRPVALLLFLLSLSSIAGLEAGGAASSEDKPTQRQIREELGRLEQAIKRGEENEISSALKAIARGGGVERLAALMKWAKRVSANQQTVYWTLIRGIGSFRDRPSLEHLGKAILKDKKGVLGRDALYALTRNSSRFRVYAFGPVLQQGAQSLKELAAEGLGSVKSPVAVDYLVEALLVEYDREKEEQSTLAHLIVESLTRLTGKTFGFATLNWQSWWKKNRDRRLRGASKSGGGSKTSTGTAVDYLDRERRKRFVGVEKAPKRAVVVLSATFSKKAEIDLNNDYIEVALESMGVPHTVVPRDEFLRFDLSKTGAVLINCAQFHRLCICPDCKQSGGIKNRLRECSGCNRHIPFFPRLSSQHVKKLKTFVAGGGFVFCEDWSVKEFLENAYPKYVTSGEKLRRTKAGAINLDDEPTYLKSFSVDVFPARGQATHPYLRGVFAGDRSVRRKKKLVKLNYEWLVDDESFALKVHNKSRVVPLLVSPDLEEDVGDDSLVALAFRPGSKVPPGRFTGGGKLPGVVMQVLSHFGHQESVLDQHSIQNLLLNFLIDANVETRYRTGLREEEEDGGDES